MRSPALISTCSKAGCYAVLASLSERYPPLEGRSPTRYSPVCHSTCPFRGFRVRLACVRHAASVDSEPGSNSQVKVVSFPFGKLNSFNVKRLLMTWLSRCSVRQVMSGSQPATVGELHPLHRKALRHPLILDGLFQRGLAPLGTRTPSETCHSTTPCGAALRTVLARSI